MKIGVIGSRGFNDYELLSEILREFQPTMIVSGGAKGADKLAEKWATENNIPTNIFLPDWSKGKGAAAIRNKSIVNNSELIIAFWDGESKGTNMTINIAERSNVPVKVVIYTKITDKKC